MEPELDWAFNIENAEENRTTNRKKEMLREYLRMDRLLVNHRLFEIARLRDFPNQQRGTATACHFSHKRKSRACSLSCTARIRKRIYATGVWLGGGLFQCE